MGDKCKTISRLTTLPQDTFDVEYLKTGVELLEVNWNN